MILADIKALLEYNNLEESVYIGILPPTPDNLVALFLSGGYSPVLKDIQQPTFQVRVRHSNYLEGYRLIEKIKNILINSGGYSTEEKRYVDFFQLGDIGELGRDENNRIGFSINFRTYIEANGDGVPVVPGGGDCSEIVNELNLQIKALTEEKEGLEAELLITNNSNSTLITKIEELENNILEINKEIESLTLQLLSAQGIISSLELDVETKTIRITELEEDNSIKTVKIIELNKNIEGLTLQITTKDEEIDTLNLTISSRDVIIENLEIDITSKNFIIEEITRENEGKNTVISSLQVDIEAKRLEIITLNNTIIEKEEVIMEKIGEIEVKDSIIIARDDTISEQEGIITTRDAEIVEKDGIIESKDLIILNKKEIITEKDGEIKTKDSLIISLKNEIGNKEGQIAKLETDLIGKTTELGDAQAQILTLQGEITTLQERIAELEAGAPEPQTGMGKIYIDLGSEDYLTEALNWNNLTNHIDGSITNLIDENMNPTGISLEVTKAFSSILINTYNDEFSDFYHNNVIKDGFYNNRRNGTIKLNGLNPDKYYKVTVFASGSSGGSVCSLQINDVDTIYSAGHESVINTPFLNNKGKTSSRTLRPRFQGIEQGQIYIVMRSAVGDRGSLNSIEIEEMKPFI